MSNEGTRFPPEQLAWSYFELHSKQRMQCFNFFLAASGALIAATSAILSEVSSADAAMLLLAVPIPVLNLLICFVFWKLDQRTSFLIKHAEAVLQTHEASPTSGVNANPPPTLFTGEERLTRIDQSSATVGSPLAPLTYRQAFLLSYAGVAALAGIEVVGLVGIAAYHLL